MTDISSNQQIHLQSLPQVEEMDLQSLSPRYRVLNIQISLILWGALALISAIVHWQPLFELSSTVADVSFFATFCLIFISISGATYHFFADPKKQYAIREHDVHFHSGLFFRRLVSQPIMRIQHIEIARGPIERSAGLATLQVYSAGGANHAFQIPGLVHEQAIQLRQYILDHKDVKENG
ncbi:PH domain-containing protein [Glaciecola sp. MH2013]|uniref:PH domain-containing protein n=1 Tax=Glaciecola sp. MH2013 TaxID=2785524 RepID=UPI0018A024E5|nr:PH domain-containing protein [Glaciecola sp. MH2013]MBF7074860.1 PH domain-containing protein [Glaciecola sp. MH2013]